MNGIARSEQAAEGVYNYITVASQARSLGDVDQRYLGHIQSPRHPVGPQPGHPSTRQIVTYGNVTYVMGILTPEEQARVTQKVSTTVGVQKVVTLYQNYVAN